MLSVSDTTKKCKNEPREFAKIAEVEEVTEEAEPSFGVAALEAAVALVAAAEVSLAVAADLVVVVRVGLGNSVI